MNISSQFTMILVAIVACATHAIRLRAEAPPGAGPLPQATLSIQDSEHIKPKICRISPGERNSVLKQGALLALRKNKSVAGLDLFGAPSQSTLSSVYYRVYIEDRVFEDVGKLTQLEYLNFYGVDLTRGIGLKCLAKLENLRKIYLTNCNVEIKQVLAHLPKCPNLEIVMILNQLPDNSKRFDKRQVVSAKEIARFTSRSPKLKMIVLQSTERYEPEAITQFVKLAHLDHFHIRTVGNMPAKSFKVIPQQHAEGKKLEKLFTDHGFKRIRHSGQRWKKSFSIPHTMIHVPRLGAHSKK